ncbi:immunoglobulin-like domain-containing protein, partial [Winogradskyella bathintestinalis]
SDTTKPVINLNGAATITLEACSDTYTELGANATDNCSVGAVTVGGDTVDANTPGIYTVTYNVTDTNGAAADEVTRIVTVNDTTKPIINLNGAATITLEACSDTYTELGANATDNCSAGAVTVGGDTVDANTPGIYTVTYNVTDTNGVAADEITRIVTVSDTTKPVINLIGTATITLEACTDTYTELGANATDNCSVGAVTVGGDTVDANTPGIYTVTYNVTDTNGVAADEVTRIVTVSDTTDPTASNPADIDVQCLTDVPAVDITVVTDEADNCGTPTVAFVSQTADPAINNGTITRTYSVTDASGNSINVFQDINIVDNTDPTASNPADIDVQCLTDVPAVDITVVTDEADNCGTPTVAFVSQTADPAINNGTIIRTYSVTDASGNSINVFQNINILDNTDPTASNPADIDVQCLTDVPAVDITVVIDEADNCGTPTVAFVSQTADPAINNGTIIRTYSVTDASGNSINVFQNINILDNTDPT